MREFRVALTLVVLLGRELVAQRPTETEIGRFASEARRGTARYRDVEVARAEGFKRVGVAFPKMGEHWVSLARVMANRFSPAEPSVLTYVTVNGQRRLVGVAYTAMLRHGELPPTSAAPRSAWHEHNGTVADESFPLHHAAGADRARDPDELGLSILHAWVWAANPAGVFVTDNATLPYLRMGTAPGGLSADALSGLALAQDSEGYFELTARTGLRSDESESRVLEQVIRAHRRRAMAQLRRPHREELGVVWRSLWTALETQLPARQAAIAELRARF